MKKPNQRLLYLLPLLLTVALIVFGEALGDLWKEDVKAVFQQNKWLLLAFVLLIALVGYLWERQQSSEKTAPEEVDKDQYDEAFVQFRKNLLEQYQTRLNSKTGRRLPVNLTAKSTHFGTAPERVEAYFKDKELTIESENIASEMDKILKKFDRLLLIGDPGAGKTTILLYAAINILNTSYSSDDFESSDEKRPLRSEDSKSSDRSDSKSPDRSKLPLILNLATWSDSRDFAEWYAQSIAHTYSLSPVFVQELLRRNAVVPFFDGFDEVAEKYRDDCFQKMATYFGDQSSKQLIVSSRKKEYAAALADAPVYAEIEVQPLSLAQIKKALSENAQSQVADRALLHALEHDRWLAEAVETPFYLNTASFLFGKGQRTLADFSFRADSTEGRQAELVKIFVAEQVPEERDRKYLGFLARKMEQANKVMVELADVQPWWLRKKWWHRPLLSIPLFLIGGHLILVLVWAYRHQISKLPMELEIVITIEIALNFLILMILSEFERSPIKTSEQIKWSWKKFKKGLIADTTNLGCLVIAYFILLSLLISWGWDTLAIILITIIFVGLIQGLFEKFLLRGVLIERFLQIQYPYQRFIGSLRAFNLSLFRHLILRLTLSIQGLLPLCLVTFMDRMSDQLIFEDNRRTDKKGRKMRGATWRFRHKILQDYFAGHP